MEFVEEESRPRFQLQSRPASSSTSKPQTLAKPSKLHLFCCYSLSLFLLSLAFVLLSHEILSFLLIWISLSLLLAPFAPSSATAGDPRVGCGDPLPPPSPAPSHLSDDRPPSRRPRSRKPDPDPTLKPLDPTPNGPNPKQSPSPAPKSDKADAFEEKEWTAEDFEILKKQISKHPVGEPRRWEKIAEAFERRHGVESVIKMAKSMAERRPEDKDSFAQFLKQRKAVDKRVEDVEGELREGSKWSSAEDIAVLNALKAFPKEVSMRWEKVAAAVPGRTKADCMKRVAELKKDFRSSKATES